MRQNKYDDAEFFAKYSEMPRSINGLDGATEWPAFRSLLTDLDGKRVLDLGCGFGWHCRYAREQRAAAVVGVDLSENMLARARAATSDPGIEYRRLAIEDIAFEPGEFDVVISSLALHYVERFDLVCRKVCHALSAGGSFVFSVEHPIFTAVAAQQWCVAPDGKRLHWPVDTYADEGAQSTDWLCAGVIKHHRPFATYINDLIEAGFCILKALEPVPPPEMSAKHAEFKEEHRRPMFLLIAAARR